MVMMGDVDRLQNIMRELSSAVTRPTELPEANKEFLEVCVCACVRACVCVRVCTRERVYKYVCECVSVVFMSLRESVYFLCKARVSFFKFSVHT